MSAETTQPGPIGLDEPDPVREQERFDPERLRPFLESSFPGASGPISLLQFRKGHSNLTYFVGFGGHEAVLRRAPFGAPRLKR
jgi:aminoglycoside phosphotransferase (APT) family kinase protein